MFDIYFYPFRIQDETEYGILPGFYVSTPKRKAARNRAEDILIIYFSNINRIKPDENEYLNELLSKTAQRFYRTSGTITSSMKKTAEFFNEQILKFNLTKVSRPTLIGSLQLMVLHHEEMYILQAGPAASFVLSKGTTRKNVDESANSTGLGISKSVRFRYYRAELSSGDRIVLSGKAPNAWTEKSLSGSTRLSISHLRKLLIHQANKNFEALIIQVRPGDGSIRQLKLSTPQAESGFSSESSNQIDKTESKTPVYDIENEKISENSYAPEHQSQTRKASFEEDGLIDEVPSFRQEDRQSTFKDNSGHEKVGHSQTLEILNSEPVVAQETVKSGITLTDERVSLNRPEKVQRKPEKPLVNSQQVVSGLITARQQWKKLSTSGKKISGKIKAALGSVFAKSIPGESDKMPVLSPASMLIIAIVVPVIVVAIATTVYFKNGRGEQHQTLILEADQYVSSAVNEKDINTKIILFQEALDTLAEAEQYGRSEALTELRNVVQTNMDQLQGVSRIDVQQTVAGGLDRRIKIVSMVSSYSEDVYALDQDTGRVIRLIATRPDYEVDTGFQCGPGAIGNLVVGPLVDIQPIEVTNSFGAAIMGIDQSGNLLFCVPGEAPIATSLSLPDLGWGNIQAIAFNGFTLYVLDTGNNTRDIYAYASDNLTFSENPSSLFNQNIPENLTNMLDMGVYQDDLFLLQNNGQITQCNSGGSLVETICDMNIGYGVIHSGQRREVVDTIANTEFQQISVTQPPDPSVYFLDRTNSAVYHFSLALNMQKQVKPNLNTVLYPPEEELSAFTISPSGLVHFAFGHQLYFGLLP